MREELSTYSTLSCISFHILGSLESKMIWKDRRSFATSTQKTWEDKFYLLLVTSQESSNQMRLE